jgi:hypothetical protein
MQKSIFDEFFTLGEKCQSADCFKNRLLTRQDFQSVQGGDFALAGVEGGEVGCSCFEGCGAHGSDQLKN